MDLSISRRDLELKAKNIWRKHHRLITLIAGAAVLGMLIAALNTWNYENTKQKFQLEEPQVIGNQQDARFYFQLQRPSVQADTTLRLTIKNLQQDSSVQVAVNGQQLRSISQSETLVKIPSDTLRQNNTVRVYQEGISFNTQRLVDASVTSYTSMQQLLFVLLNFASILLIFTPVAYVKYQDFQERKKVEDEFPSFLRDVVQGTRAGMSLPQAIQNTESGSYGPLNDHIQRMSAQIEWGIPFDEVLENFSGDIKSPLVKRSVDTIIQAYSSGGNIQDVLESVGDNIRQIKQLQEERSSQLYSEMITGYIVYFIFIGILVALTTFLLPNLATASQSLGGGLSILGSGGGGSLQENITLYNQWFQRLVFIQALFSGLIIGKLSEGELKAGIKHSAILFAAGYLAVTFFL
ncbi:MAG: type II secretion system F family protein [Candidatus Nanohaloarchaea archaeon]